MVVTSVPDSVFNHIKGSANAKSIWDELKKIFEGCTRNLLIDLGRKLQNMRCREDNDVHTHFELLANHHKQLAAMGQIISDEQYTNILMGSLPSSYNTNISIIMTNANMSSTTITPATIICIITDEYNKHVLKNPKPKILSDEVFATDAQKNKKKNKCDIECFNCHKKGHMKSECWAKGGSKEGQGPKKTAGTKEGAAVVTKKTKDVEAWAVFNEVEEECTQKLPKSLEELPDTIAMETKLYDLGVSRHMSPFWSKFTTYQSIPPQAIVSANKCIFYAQGVGNLQIEVPNGDVLTPVLLKDTLYMPQIGLTVVSIGRIAKASYLVSFEDNCCQIKKGSNNQIVRSIHATGNRLYKVEHALTASMALKQVNILTLH